MSLENKKSKLFMKKGHRQVIENSRQDLSEQVFYRKQSLGVVEEGCFTPVFCGFN